MSITSEQLAEWKARAQHIHRNPLNLFEQRANKQVIALIAEVERLHGIFNKVSTRLDRIDPLLASILAERDRFRAALQDIAEGSCAGKDCDYRCMKVAARSLEGEE